MSKAIHIGELDQVQSASKRTGRKGFWRSLLNREIEARTRRGEAHVRQHVACLSDETLANLGLTGDEIATLRMTGRIPLRPAD